MSKRITASELASFLSKVKGGPADEVTTAILAGSLGTKNFDDKSEADIDDLIQQIKLNRKLLKEVRKQLMKYRKNGKAS